MVLAASLTARYKVKSFIKKRIAESVWFGTLVFILYINQSKVPKPLANLLVNKN